MKRQQPDQSEATLNAQEIQGILTFLNRVDLKGTESDAHAALKFKLNLMGQQALEKQQNAAMPDNVTELEGLSGEHREG